MHIISTSVGARTAILCPGKRIPAAFARLQALLGGEGCAVDVLTVYQCLTNRGFVGPASEMIIVLDHSLVKRWESRVGLDRKDAVATTRLARVPGARVNVPRLVDLGSIDDLTAVTTIVVGNTCIAEAIAFADGDTFLDRHVMLVKGCTPRQGIGVAGVLEAARIHEGPEGIKTRRWLEIGRLHTTDDGKRRQGGQRLERYHSKKQGGPQPIREHRSRGRTVDVMAKKNSCRLGMPSISRKRQVQRESIFIIHSRVESLAGFCDGQSYHSMCRKPTPPTSVSRTHPQLMLFSRASASCQLNRARETRNYTCNQHFPHIRLTCVLWRNP